MKLERTRVFRGEHAAGEIHRPDGGGPSYLDLRDVAPDPETLDPVARHLDAGGLLGYPAGSVYGFGGPATAEGVDALGRLRGQDPEEPAELLVPDMAAADELLWTPEARELAELFWPGSLTLVLEDPTAAFPPGVRSRRGTVAVRVSAHPFVRALLGLRPAPLLFIRAGVPGEENARDGRAAAALGPELGAGESLVVVECGTLPASSPPTLVDCTGPAPLVIREGSVPVGRMRCALPGLESLDG